MELTMTTSEFLLFGILLNLAIFSLSTRSYSGPSADNTQKYANDIVGELRDIKSELNSIYSKLDRMGIRDFDINA
jgi:hypothetical protein